MKSVSRRDVFREPIDERVEAAELLEEREGVGEEESGGRDDGTRLSVTQSSDPRSGGHFAVGMSKPPLRTENRK